MMEALSNLFKPKKKEKKPVGGMGERFHNLFTKHYRGLIGGIVPFIAIPFLLEKGDHAKTVTAMWLWMAWSFIWQPVNPSVTGLIPIFLLPMTCALTTDSTCQCYINEGMLLFIISNMLLLMINNSGLDRRLVLWFLSAGDAVQCSAPKLMFKCSTAGFFVSVISSKLVVSNIMVNYIATIMNSLKSAAKPTDPDFDEMRYILCNAISTSCTLGGLAIVHGSYSTLAFRNIFYETQPKDHVWRDIFNYLEYTIFAFPVALAMLIANIIYHIFLLKIKCGKEMSAASMNTVRNTLMDFKKEIPAKITTHEKITLVCFILVMATFFSRYSKYYSGWSGFSLVSNLPGVRDATVAATFVCLFHALPSGFRFIKIWGAKKKSTFGPLKPESAILWWRFVDKNIVYGYLFLIGSGVVLSVACAKTGLNKILVQSSIAQTFIKSSEKIYFISICVVSVIMSNVMTSVAMVTIVTPLVMHLVLPEDMTPSESLRDSDVKLPVNLVKIYLGALAVGLGGSFGFAVPYLYTTTYFSHQTGKVPRIKIAVYGVGSAIICCLLLFVFISFYGPILWKPTNFKYEMAPAGASTTAAPAAPAPEA